MTMTFHEQLYRDSDAMARLASLRLTICGAGALGANLAETLARMGARRIRVIDRDHIETRNLSTQPWESGDVGSRKADLIGSRLYRIARLEAESICRELTDENAERYLTGSDLVLDTFDNTLSRAAVIDFCAEKTIPCLHAGLAGDYAEVVWNDDYRLPSSTLDDICDYPLARNLVLLTVAVAAECVIRFAADGCQESYTIALRDFAIRPYLKA